MQESGAAMRIQFANRLGIVAVWLLILAGRPARSQETIQLVPQVGMGWVMSASFSPNGQAALTLCDDGSARLWDVKTGKQIRTFQGNMAFSRSAVFSPDALFVLISDGEQARLWDAASGQLVRSFTADVLIGSIAFSHDGRFVLAGDGKTARIWDAASGAPLKSFLGHTDSVFSVAFSQDDRYILTGSTDHSARLWDVATSRQIRSFDGQVAEVLSVAFSPDGSRVLTGGMDRTVRLWDTATGHQLLSFPGVTEGANSVAFSPDGRSVLAATGDHAMLWDALTGQPLRPFVGHSDVVYTATFSSDGRFVLTGSADHTARLWDSATAKEIRSFQGQAKIVNSVAISPSGHFIAAAGGDQELHLWDTQTGQLVRSFAGHEDAILAVAFSPDSRSLLTGSADHTARLWDTETGQMVRIFSVQGHFGYIRAVAFSPDGQLVATGSTDHTGSLWRVATGEQLHLFEGHTEAVRSVLFSGDGHIVATVGEDHTAKLWEASSGRLLSSFQVGATLVVAAAISPDGRLLLTGGADSTATLWDIASGQRVRSFEGHTGIVTSVAFAPNRRTVLTGGADKTAALWEAGSGKRIRTFEGHTSWVASVGFSPDGRFILTGGYDATTRLWDAATGRQLAALISFENGGWTVVDPDGRFDSSDLDGNAPLVWVASSEPLRPLPLEIFMRDYYTPRLLARIMNGEKLPHIRSIAEITNRVQPDVAVVSVSASKTYPGRADVVVHAASHTNEKGQASGLQDLRLFRNGQMVGYVEGPLKDGDFTFPDIQLPTSMTGVTFAAYAFNSMNIKSATAQKDYAYEPGAPAKPHAYLLQIGVNHYQASNCELHGSANDAEELNRVLTERLTARELDVKPVRLISTNTENGATKENIREALAAIASVATPDDVFFLSFSGHGYGDTSGQFYIFPSDVKGSCQGVDDAMLKQAISADELAEWLRPIDAGEMTFILDSCQSASSVEANDFKPGPMGSRGLGQLAYDKRMRILAASQSNQAARESEALHQGLLSYALTEEGLVEGKADWKPVDQKITVGEWLSYAADAVPKSLEAGAVKTTRGMTRIGAPTPHAKSAQIPAVFDFSKKNTFVLQ